MRQIVDSKDAVIGHKKKSDMDYANDVYRVTALWLRNSKGEVLLAQRSLSKDDNPDRWGPAVAGTVEKDETYESNIYKEAEEEIGLVNVDFVEGPKVRVRKPRNYFCQWFTGIIDRDASDFVLQKDEVEAVWWVLENQLFEDVRKNPKRYIEGFEAVVELFSKGTSHES